AAPRGRPAPSPARPLRRTRRDAVPLCRRRDRLPGLSIGRLPRACAPGRTLDRRRRARATMSSRTCPDWPDLMELAPELQFKHYTVAEAQLPADALMLVTDTSLAYVAICADLDKNV